MNWIKKIVGLEYEIHNGFALRALSSFPYGTESTGSYLTDMVSVRTTRKGKKIVVYLETHRPGILIGAKGWQINALREYINSSIFKPFENADIHFHIIESKMFWSENCRKS